MKTPIALFLFAAAFLARSACSQPQPTPPAGDYASDLTVITQSQQQALEQARQLLAESQNPSQRTALQFAIADMERADKKLQESKTTPANLPAAVAAEQAAYQALLKLIPREYRLSRSRRGSRNGRAGQPGQRQLDQLETGGENDRYETERQAASTPNEQQREKLDLADRLKQMAQRQQDLNDRLRELQTALQEARTESQRQDIERQLKRLTDEERQMLSDLDDLRQKVDQSPNRSSLSDAARQLEQTRSEAQQAAQHLADQSVSQALASGARAQQNMQNLRESLRGQTSSQFSGEMRQLQKQARDLARQEEDIARGVESLQNPDHQSLDNAAQRGQLARQMAQQENGLTNLLSAMQDLTEKTEGTEPLLSEQLYDTLRRASQLHTDSLLEAGSELLDRGFLAKAAETERAARTNLNEIRQRVERAAETVLGSQTEALRYAQSELNDLAKEVERETGASGTNSTHSLPGASGSTNAAAAQTNAAAAQTNAGGGADRLGELVRQMGGERGGAPRGGPILGSDFANWADRMRDVEQVVDSDLLRNRLAAVRERVAAFRAEYRLHDRLPPAPVVRFQVLEPMAEVRLQLREDLARLENARSLVPLDHDPVPDNYSELVRKYYEKLGGGQ
jgi:DNA repair exonuclease SbcCD ATPase subunit